MSASDAPIASKAPPLTAARFGHDAIWPSSTSAFRNATSSSSPTDAPSARYDFGGMGQPPNALASPPNSANIMNGYPSLTSGFPSQRTPTQSTFSRADSIGNQGLLPQPAQQAASHNGDSATTWTFPEHLQPSTSIPDGEPFPHLPQPFASSGTEQLPSTLSPIATLPSPQSSKPAASRSSRKKDKARDEPQSLEELRDPPPGQKPDYPYPTLIRCAILSHSKRSPTLSEIYDMIHKRFSFFKMDDAGWKNSVRHYLSISPSFVKIPRPITEPGKGNYWTYDANPPNKASRRSKRAKRKPDRDDELAPVGEYDGGGRTHRLPRHSPPLPLNGRYTPSSSDIGDPLRSGLPSLGARDRGIASRQKSPAHGWLEARDNSLGGPPKHRENLPPAQTLFGDIGRPPVHLSSHINGSGSGGTGVSSVSPYAAGDDAFNMPQSPYAPANRTGSGSVGGSGTGGNGALDFGASPVFPGRDQSQYRPGSSTYSQTLPALPGLGESFFSSINAERRQSRHGEEPLLPSMSTSTNGNYNSLPSSLRSPPLARTDSSSSQQYRYDQPALSSNGHW
ncbi:hypothetical protein EXIGLDRAFT_828022 [Exidia glandulosa HHB12029]|uniref:Fork-head domain-containing protein n=1 Tax=Exidia glandulosa HHB12029 TaxID=1314781 RepID=A0A165QUP0_EXIGL|nr:hypothetical protein EXIGLDRAFT_828022 [Exidia glandulosa HHB12029]